MDNTISFTKRECMLAMIFYALFVPAMGVRSRGSGPSIGHAASTSLSRAFRQRSSDHLGSCICACKVFSGVSTVRREMRTLCRLLSEHITP